MALLISTLRSGREIPRSGQAQIVLPHAVEARTPIQLNYNNYLVVKGSELQIIVPKIRTIAYF